MQDIRRFEIRNWLQSLLKLEDRTSMAFGLETRVPLLDHRVVELAFKLQDIDCIDGTTNKLFLKKTFRGCLPDWLLDKKLKQGYTAPIDAWLQQDEVQEYWRKLFSNPNSFIFKFVGKDASRFSPRAVWMLVSLSLWHERFFGD